MTHRASQPTRSATELARTMSDQDREDLAYILLQSLPRSRLAGLRDKINPLLEFDILGLLPDEIALHVLSHLPWQSLLCCSAVNRRWRTLAEDPSLWKTLCRARGIEWKQPFRHIDISALLSPLTLESPTDTDDEGMGDEIYSSSSEPGLGPRNRADVISADYYSGPVVKYTPTFKQVVVGNNRHSAPSSLPTSSSFLLNYKLLHQTHTRLYMRFLYSSYRLSTLQTRPGGRQNEQATINLHTSTIYCLQLYTNPQTGVQTLFTGSKDKSIREWDLQTSQFIRVVHGVHLGSVLSLAVHGGLLCSAGSDSRVCIWDLVGNTLLSVIHDHTDSVLAVRLNEKRLVSCSKDETVRTYLFPNVAPHLVLEGHRAAVNAVALAGDLLASASGDRSIRIWNAENGQLVRVFENHHNRGIASIDFRPPYILTGSSDMHIRLIDIDTGKGWSTSEELDAISPNGPSTPEADLELVTCVDEEYMSPSTSGVCKTCGHGVVLGTSAHGIIPGQAGMLRLKRYSNAHTGLVRSVCMNEEWVVSGSYDSIVKIWNRKTGAFIGDLTGGHTGRAFGIGFDCTKVVSVGEDQRICLWDFAHGIDTSFIKL